MWWCRVEDRWVDPADHCLLTYDDEGRFAWVAIGHDECSPYGEYWTKERQ